MARGVHTTRYGRNFAVTKANETRTQPATTPASGPQPPGGRVLVVEPDHLTAWSLATFLQRWYEVETTNCTVAAEKSLRERAPVAVIVSDQLPGQRAQSLLQLAQRANPAVRAVLMVSREADPSAAVTSGLRLEKPFDLTELARLLGIPGAAPST